jgi:hypothetical protein
LIIKLGAIGLPRCGATGRMAKWGGEMRLLVVATALCAIGQTAAAQTPDCKSIPDARVRLSCYDKAAPPARAKPAAAHGAAASKVEATKDPAKYVDAISAEDALMNTRLKNICRGC